jgi:hypothetical protein
MAHFAQIDETWTVLRVVVINNAVLLDEYSIERDWLGEQFCQSLYGSHTKWIQTSYNGKKYKNFAGIGYTFDPYRHAFIPPKPFPSWTLNEATCQWQAPIAHPSDKQSYQWDENSLNWIIA